jgi:hypothetical protein
MSNERASSTFSSWMGANYGRLVIRFIGRSCPGYREVQEHAVKLANENADAAFKLAKDVAQAKDLHELIDLQTRYVQSQMKWYAEQTQEFGRLMTRPLGNMKKAQS